MASEEKTNVMRLLDKKGIKYNHYCYVESGVCSGAEAAGLLNQDERRVFKTLVTVGRSRENYVFLIPVAKELDLKAAAGAVGEKFVEMLKSKELFPLTGYLHGGCSPIGMKKRFVTVVDESAKEFENIIFSAGKIGYQVEMSPADLEKMITLSYAAVAVD